MEDLEGGGVGGVLDGDTPIPMGGVRRRRVGRGGEGKIFDIGFGVPRWGIL